MKLLRSGIECNSIVTSKIFWPHYAMQCKATENPYSTIHWQSHHHHKVHRGGPRTTITHSRIHDNDLWWKIILHFPQTTRMLLKKAWSQKVFQFGSNLQKNPCQISTLFMRKVLMLVIWHLFFCTFEPKWKTFWGLATFMQSWGKSDKPYWHCCFTVISYY